MPSSETRNAESSIGINTLIQYVEVWLPNDDATQLRRIASQLVGVGDVAKVDTRGATVAIGEGVAGRAWEQKSATILQEHPCDLLDRISDQCGAKLAVIMAIPVFCQQAIRGVVVMGFGDGFGAAEIWNRDERDELAVSVSYYAGLPSFEFISRYTRFPKGAGVPGHVWKTAQPHMLQNLGKSDAFIRSFGNDPAEVTAAIGLPIGNIGGFPASVLLLLSAANTPLAAVTELWKCETQTIDDVPTLRLTSAITVGGGENEFTDERPPENWQTDLLRNVETSEGPGLVTSEEIALPNCAKFGLAIPIYRKTLLTGVLNFLF